MLRQDRKKAFATFVLVVVTVLLSVPFPLLIKYIIDFAIKDQNTNGLTFILVTFVFLIILQLVTNFCLSLISSRWTQAIATYLRNKIYTTKIGLRNIETTGEKEMMQAAIVSDCEVISDNFQTLYINIISASVSLISYAVILALLNVVLSVVILVSIPVFVLLNLKLSNLSQKYFKGIQSNKDTLLEQLTDTINGFLFIKLYNLKNEYSRKFYTETKSLEKHSVQYNTIVTFINSVVGFIAVIAPFLVLLLGAMLVLNGKSTLGSVIACYSYSGAIFSPISRLLGLMPTAKQLELSCSRVNSIINLKKQGDAISVVERNNLSNEELITIKHLTISYPNVPLIIQDMNYSFRIGNCYLLEGPNGSGKSTLGLALAGLISAKSGKILVRKGSFINYVPQRTFLFKGTILSNLTKGLRAYDKKYLPKLIEATHLDEDLASSCLTLNSEIDNRQNQMSTGQIQKIKLIRALLVNPEVLILDEIITNIDEASRPSILRLLSEWSKNKILIVISHDHTDLDKMMKLTKIRFPIKEVTA